MHDFIFWGAFGIACEIFFTGLVKSIKHKDFNLMGHSSAWMFLVYGFGLTYLFPIIMSLIPNTITRWLSYPLWIWAVEIIVAIPTRKLGVIIWDYSSLPDKWNWRGIISYVHFPVWVLFGIIIEALH